MKIILSRKGFDSSNGGIPSPILPDKSLLSLPIPYKKKGVEFSRVNFRGKDLLSIIFELRSKSKKPIKYENCHLDPDINDKIVSEGNSCKGLFGQSGAAQKHLDNQGVEEGDIFLFYGWFKQTEEIEGKIRYVPRAADKHVIFGYLQIGGKRCAKKDKKKGGFPEEMQCHPHAEYYLEEEGKNCIYQAKEKLSFDENIKGYGVFNYDDSLVLTKDNYSRSRWELPDFFKEVNISYHSKKSFKKEYFESAKIGQEFVIQCNEEIENWVRDLILKNIK